LAGLEILPGRGRIHRTSQVCEAAGGRNSPTEAFEIGGHFALRLFGNLQRHLGQDLVRVGCAFVDGALRDP